MRSLTVMIVGAFAMVGVATGSHAAPQLKFTVSPGTTSCGSAGLTVPPSAPTSGNVDSNTACSTSLSTLGLGCLYFGGGNGTIVAGGAIPDGSTSILDLSPPTNGCASAKIKAAGANAACALKLESGEAKKGVEEDETKLGGCGAKMGASFTKAETKPPCLTTGDTGAIQAKIDAFVNDLATTTATEGGAASSCDAGKLKAAGADAACRLKLESGAAKKGVPADPAKVAACDAKLGPAFTKAELKPPCTATGDAATVQGKIIAFVSDATGELAPPSLKGSAGTSSDNCTVGAGPATHCVNNNTLPACTTDANCGGANGACALDANCFFGPPLPIPSPAPFTALTTCVLNVVQTSATGTGNSATGSSTISLPLSSRVYITGNNASPCPKCLTGHCDPTWKTNTSTTSPDTNAVCTAVGSKMTTNQCRPSLPGFQAPLPVSLNPLTTGTTSETAASGLFCPNQNNAGAFGQASAQCVTETGAPAGSLLDNAPHNAHLVSVFCIPSTGAAAVDGVADLPGPGAFSLNGNAQLTP